MARFEDWLFKNQPGFFGELARLPFSVTSALYLLAVKARAAAYQKNIFSRAELSIPVVAVGNLTVGGSGKTPTALWLAQGLASKGLKPAISIRGYRSPAEQSLVVLNAPGGAAPEPAAVGDEAALLARKLKEVPVLVGKNRAEAGKKAVELGAEILILDDGFSHLKLMRNVDMVLIDGRKLLSREKIFPRGRLREPVSALRRAHLFIISRAGLDAEQNISELKAINPAAPVFKMNYRVKNAERLAGKKVFAFAGIADPAYFFDLASGYKMDLVGKKAFSDHHNYSAEELKGMEGEAAGKGAQVLLTTEKDLVKLGAFPGSLPVEALEIEPDFFGQEKNIIELVADLAKGNKKA